MERRSSGVNAALRSRQLGDALIPRHSPQAAWPDGLNW